MKRATAIFDPARERISQTAAGTESQLKERKVAKRGFAAQSGCGMAGNSLDLPAGHPRQRHRGATPSRSQRVIEIEAGHSPFLSALDQTGNLIAELASDIAHS
jgi:hypothetical protein